MADTYRIVCVNMQLSASGTHQHIVSVGVGDDTGWSHRLTVAQVRTRIFAGDVFYTHSPSTGLNALVEPWNCCGIQTLRSRPDRVKDNNLDNLPNCV
jgi:hypothetical protein